MFFTRSGVTETSGPSSPVVSTGRTITLSSRSRAFAHTPGFWPLNSFSWSTRTRSRSLPSNRIVMVRLGSTRTSLVKISSSSFSEVVRSHRNGTMKMIEPVMRIRCSAVWRASSRRSLRSNRLRGLAIRWLTASGTTAPRQAAKSVPSENGCDLRTCNGVKKATASRNGASHLLFVRQACRTDTIHQQAIA